MDYTQSVFIKETNLSQNINREKIVKNLALKENIDPDKPILMHIVNQYIKGMIGGLPATVIQGNNPKKNNEINEPIKKKNDDEEKTNNLFTKKNKEVKKTTFQ